MAEEKPQTLSEYLLRETERFILYPHPVRRTRSTRTINKILDKRGRELIDWRKTFAPDPPGELAEFFSEPVRLDQLYCRELLRSVPGFVERTLDLHNNMVLDTEAESIEYLRQAATCYVFGLAEATVALCRSALEIELRRVVGSVVGERTSAGADLLRLLETAEKTHLIKPDVGALAHRVRQAANLVVHGTPTDLQTARRVLTDCRSVLLMLLVGRRPRKPA